MAINEIPLTIDYTSRDYEALREELVARIKERIPEWNGADNSDFGVVLAEAFAYLGDVANYYIDRIANESFLSTATQRESILAIAETAEDDPGGDRRAIGGGGKGCGQLGGVCQRHQEGLEDRQ